MNPNPKYTGTEAAVLLASLFIISVCAILYELLISSISTYFLGSSILHFSLTIGFFLSAMGGGAYLSRFVSNNLLEKFIIIEIVLGLVGGLSAFMLYGAFAFTGYYYVALFSIIILLGTLIGTEIPLITRLLQTYEDLKDTIAKVLAFDYLGALVASLLFPLLLLPFLGVMRTAFLVGLINLGIATYNIYVFRKALARSASLLVTTVTISLVLVGGFFYSFSLVSFFEKFQYEDHVVYSEQTPYQKIIITNWNQDTRLYLNGNLQFSTVDEYRYHEPLIHVPLLLGPQRGQVLLLGGGDGVAAKEILKYADVSQLDMVDIDPLMTEIAATNPVFTKLNNQVFNDKRLKVINEDAFNYVKQNTKLYNIVIIDLPDPSDHAINKLYTTEFYTMLKRSMAADGIMVTQSTSPFFARAPFWCINHTLSAVFAHVQPYQAYVPSFGLWGYNIASNVPLCPSAMITTNADTCVLQQLITKLPLLADMELKFLNGDNLPGMFRFDEDTREIPTDINNLDSHELVRLYEQSWKSFN